MENITVEQRREKAMRNFHRKVFRAYLKIGDFKKAEEVKRYMKNNNIKEEFEE